MYSWVPLMDGGLEESGGWKIPQNLISEGLENDRKCCRKGFGFYYKFLSK